MGECLTRSARFVGLLDGTNWEIFEAIGKLTDQRQAAAAILMQSVRAAMQCDEHVISLGPALKEAQAAAVRLLTQPPPVVVPPVVPPPATETALKPPVIPPPRSKRSIVEQGAKENLSLDEVTELVGTLSEKLKPGQALRVSVSWVIESSTS